MATRNTRNERNLSLRFAAMAFQCSRIRSSRLAVRSNWCQICNLRVSHVQAATAMAAHHAGGGTTCAQCQGSVRMIRRRMGHCADVNTRDGARKSTCYWADLKEGNKKARKSGLLAVLLDLVGRSEAAVWCPGKDSNLHASRHTDLNRARLPIPPPGQVCGPHVCGRSARVNAKMLGPTGD